MKNPNQGIAFKVFAFITLLIMFDSFHLQFMIGLPNILVPCIGSVVLFFLMLSNGQLFKFTQKQTTTCLIFLLICLYQIVFASASLTTMITHGLTFICGMAIIFLKDDLKVEMLRVTSIAMGCILILSLAGWILYLLHIPMPHHTEQNLYNFYTITFYPTFLLNQYPYEAAIPRFTSMFLEPGHLATTCVLLLFANKMELKKWYNLLMLIAVILSFSLSAYGLLIGAYGLYYLIYGKRKVLAIILFLAFLTGLTIFAIVYKQGDNPVYELIISRLEYNESTGTIRGNNRFTSYFEFKYNQFIHSGDKYFGLGRLDASQRWWTDSAGWKRAVVTNGIVGIVLILLFYIKLAKERKCADCLALFIIWLVGNLVRDHVLKEFWLYIMIFAMPALKLYSNQRKLGKENR